SMKHEINSARQLLSSMLPKFVIEEMAANVRDLTLTGNGMWPTTFLSPISVCCSALRCSLLLSERRVSSAPVRVGSGAVQRHLRLHQAFGDTHACAAGRDHGQHLPAVRQPRVGIRAVQGPYTMRATNSCAVA